MTKAEVVKHIQEYLATELADASKHGDAQAARVAELNRLLVVYRFLPLRDYSENGVVCPAALVELELDGTRTFCFLAPEGGGGMIANVGGSPVQVVTASSPLGEALLGKRAGDIVEVRSRSSMRKYSVISIR
jgi:hypothetical protein